MAIAPEAQRLLSSVAPFVARLLFQRDLLLALHHREGRGALRRLRRDEAMIDYIMTDSTTLAFVITNDGASLIGNDGSTLKVWSQ